MIMLSVFINYFHIPLYLKEYLYTIKFFIFFNFIQINLSNYFYFFNCVHMETIINICNLYYGFIYFQLHFIFYL
jgi:hypothetical protein